MLLLLLVLLRLLGTETCSTFMHVEKAGKTVVVVIGGAQIYQLALPRADRLYLTQVHADVEGDTRFPDFDAGEWREVAREDYAAEGPNPYDYSFIVYDRA